MLVRNLNKKHGSRVTDIAPDVLELFARHEWPGNVRELRNVLERAVVVAGEGVISKAHLPMNFGSFQPVRGANQDDDPNLVKLPVGTTVDEAEKALILRTLGYTKNNKTRAAEILGISLKTLHNKLKEYGSADEEA